MSESSDQRVPDHSRSLVGGLLAFCSAAVLAFIVMDVRSPALTVALWCFALEIPLLGTHWRNFFREGRHLHRLSPTMMKILGTIAMVLPAIGMCAALAHVSYGLALAFALCAACCEGIFQHPFIMAENAEREQAFYKPPVPNILYVKDREIERDAERTLHHER